MLNRLEDRYPQNAKVAGGGTPFDRKRLEVELDRARLYQRECDISIEEHQDADQAVRGLQPDSPDWHALRGESLAIERDGAALNVRRLELNLREFDYWAERSKVKAGMFGLARGQVPRRAGDAAEMLESVERQLDEATGVNSGLGSVA